ncbi:TPA: RHS repeat protein, partial [Salmonella enterica]|nr:RHS repeat protein [Salmonella enterica]
MSEESRAWLAGWGGLTPEQLEVLPEPERKLYLYHCDHRG